MHLSGAHSTAYRHAALFCAPIPTLPPVHTPRSTDRDQAAQAPRQTGPVTCRDAGAATGALDRLKMDRCCSGTGPAIAQVLRCPHERVLSWS